MEIKHRLQLYVCDPDSSLAILLDEAKQRIIELEALDDNDYIKGLESDVRRLSTALLKAGQEDKVKADDIILKADQIAFLEGKLKTAKADGIREAVDEIEYDEDCDERAIWPKTLLEYADQLEADNEQD